MKSSPHNNNSYKMQINNSYFDEESSLLGTPATNAPATVDRSVSTTLAVAANGYGSVKLAVLAGLIMAFFGMVVFTSASRKPGISPMNLSWEIVEYQGMQYATLDSANPHDTSTSGCQTQGVLMRPGGWSLAKEGPGAVYVAASYGWGTERLTGDNIFLNTKNYMYPGSYSRMSYAGKDENGYWKPYHCPCRILIQRPLPMPTSAPSQEPTPFPSYAPSHEPSPNPSEKPTEEPTEAPVSKANSKNIRAFLFTKGVTPDVPPAGVVLVADKDINYLKV